MGSDECGGLRAIADLKDYDDAVEHAARQIRGSGAGTVRQDGARRGGTWPWQRAQRGSSRRTASGAGRTWRCGSICSTSASPLSVAYRHAAETLADRGGVVFAIQGNFHHLPRYGQLFVFATASAPATAGHDDLATHSAISKTSCALCATALALAPGICCCSTSVDTHRRTDPPKRSSKRSGLLKSRRNPNSALRQRWDDFLVGLIRRYANVQTEIDVQRVLDLSCPIPAAACGRRGLGSGCLPARSASSVYYSRRWRFAKLQAALFREGWETIANWVYGGDVNPCMLSCCKSGPPLRLVE